jgi:hypothetical protein
VIRRSSAALPSRELCFVAEPPAAGPEHCSLDRGRFVDTSARTEVEQAFPRWADLTAVYGRALETLPAESPLALMGSPS